MTYNIQVRRDTAANWTSTDPTLTLGEMGYESDTNRFKIGDGSTAWTSQSYVHPGASWCDLRSDSISQTHNTTIVIDWVEVIDTDGYFTGGTPSRVFAPFTGLYFFSWNIVYSSATNRFIFETWVNINREGSNAANFDIPMSSNAKSLQSTTYEGAIKHDIIVSLTKGDYLEVVARQFGVTRTIQGDQGGAQMRFIG